MPISRKNEICGIIGPRLDVRSGWVYILTPIPSSGVLKGKYRRVNLFKIYPDGAIGVRVRQSGKLVKVNKGFLDGFAERLTTENSPQPE